MPLGFLETFWVWRKAIASWAGMAWDIETERLDPASPTRCVGFELLQGQPREVIVSPLPLSECGPFHDRAWPGQLLIAHNAKYEAQALQARGIDPHQFVWWDTMLAEWVLLANNTKGLGLNLDDTAQRYGCTPKDPWVDEMIKAGRVMEIPLDQLMERNRKDVADCRTVYEGQLARMTEKQIRLTIIRSMNMLELGEIEAEGKALDPARVAVEVERNAREIAEHELALRDITGGANPRSASEMAPVLYGLWPANVADEDRGRLVPGCDHPEAVTKAGDPRAKGCPVCKSTAKRLPVVEPLGFKEPTDDKGKPMRTAPTAAWPGGKPSTAADAMAKVAKSARTPRQRTWAAHFSKLVDLYSERDKNLRYFSDVCTLSNGVVYPDLMQGITATHRLSCRARPRPGVTGGAQLQTTPAHLKSLFRAKRAGYLPCEVDQSQAEFRAAIWLTRCPRGLADLVNPRFDAHIQTAQVIRDGAAQAARYDELYDQYKAGDKAAKVLRNEAKAHTFKPLFGGGSGTPGERAYYKAFKEDIYTGIKSAQEEWESIMEQTGRYFAPTGMVFSWPIGWYPGFGGRMNAMNASTGKSLYTIIRNLPIQYFATGELAMVSSLSLIYEARRLGIRYHVVMFVHDSVEGEVHADDVEAWHRACGEAYGPLTFKALYDIYGIDYDIELASESSHGTHFGEGSARGHKFTRTQKDIPMKFSAGGEKKPRTNVSAGTHVAILNQVVDMGVQMTQGQHPGPKQQVYFRFEVPEERIEYRRGEETLEGPLVIGTKFTASMNSKALMRKFVEGFIGKKLTDAEASQYDVTTLLGKPCMITVVETQKGDQTYANISQAAPLPKALAKGVYKAERPLLVYDGTTPDESVLKLLAPWVQKVIADQIKPGEPGDVPPSNGPGAPDLGAE